MESKPYSSPNLIPFNHPYTTGSEIHYISQAISLGVLSGNGHFTKNCHHWLENTFQCRKALLTQSCTAALEMAALLIDVQPGDEIIMPSYTFVSTANAFVLRGAIPVFVDICPRTLNITAENIESAITPRTKAIVPVHYAGVSCDMDPIMEIANRHQLWVIEDAAQAFGASYKRKPLGSIGHLATLSFHETKNIISGEGGALLINHPDFVSRAEIIWEKGTNRAQFYRGEIDKYTWVDIGSSYLPSEITAAFLWAQLEKAEEINQSRGDIWNRYHQFFSETKKILPLQIPFTPHYCKHNHHLYFILLSTGALRNQMLDSLKAQGIQALFHYIPLHSSPYGKKYCRTPTALPTTDDISARILRLPLWLGMKQDLIHSICNTFVQTYQTTGQHE